MKEKCKGDLVDSKAGTLNIYIVYHVLHLLETRRLDGMGTQWHRIVGKK